MRALIFAAGRGSRLRPHTDWVPKPLLPVGKYRLWDWQISGLKKAGITDLVVNTAYLSDAFEPMPEAYAARGITMKISREGDKETDALETRGGIAKARVTSCTTTRWKGSMQKPLRLRRETTTPLWWRFPIPGFMSGAT